MSIYLRNGIWHIYIVTSSGKRIRRSAKTSSEVAAQELHDKLKHDLWRIERLGDKPKYTWDEACIRFIQEKAHKKSLDDDKQKMRLLVQFRGMLLIDITRDFIMNTISRLSCGNSTKNRYLTLIRTILNLCAGAWEWIDKAPKLTLYKEPKRRIRWLTKTEACRLISVLHRVYADLAEFSFMTGLRQSNALSLEWSQVDLDRGVAWIHADQTKSGMPIGVPLNQIAIDVLRRRMAIARAHKMLLESMPKHQQQSRDFTRFVFVSDLTKRPLTSIGSNIWQKALAEAGIENFRWHDIRHTWASWLVQSGVGLLELKEMGGWESIEMVQKYAHLAPQHLHKNAVLLENGYATFTPHVKNPPLPWTVN
ncbi:MAG: site-specific integrase [Neisseriaceae bacterium]|nr:site-specific integrase [Neisseriaceae bacterium]